MDTHFSNRNQMQDELRKNLFILWNGCHLKGEFKILTIHDAICGLNQGKRFMRHGNAFVTIRFLNWDTV